MTENKKGSISGTVRDVTETVKPSTKDSKGK